MLDNSQIEVKSFAEIPEPKVVITSTATKKSDNNRPQLAKSSSYSFGLSPVGIGWESAPNPNDVDKLDYNEKEFKKLVESCRFYYRKDPIASTVINKMIEISMTKLIIEQNSLSDNEYRVFLGLSPALLDFAEQCAMEYLITGLVIPEVSMEEVNKDFIKKMHIKKYEHLNLPVSMWLRNPGTVKIKSPMVSDKPSYYAIIPSELISFVTSKGKYTDGTEDKELYEQLKVQYPNLILAIQNGEKEILLKNDRIIRRKVLSDSPYPTPYLLPAIEALKHKRNLRRMDYSIASRVISAIQLFKLGSDEFPILEGNEEQFGYIKDQMIYRNSNGKDIERIFQLFANHTLEIEWIFPPTDALLDEKKYVEVNDDIFFSLGFPRILTTGEAARTGASDPEFATLSPMKTMENLQRHILSIIQSIVDEVSELNNFKSSPLISFEKINLHKFSDFVTGMKELYTTGNISGHTLTSAFGYNWEEEIDLRSKENDKMKEMEIEAFPAQPFTPQAGKDGQKPQNTDKSPSEKLKSTENSPK